MNNYGFKHPPQADIEAIRDILKGYYPKSILKELIQNAEDAKSKQIRIRFVSGIETSSQPLFRGPGLIVSNDGEFKKENSEAIAQINLGTKSTNEDAIGRFGKGLKSVFTWCEAFFYFGYLTEKKDYESFYLNPWSGWLHKDWDDAFNNNRNEGLFHIKEEEDKFYGNGKTAKWLAFWLPLRRSELLQQESDSPCLHQSRPGDDEAFLKNLNAELRALSPSLVNLKNLQTITLCNSDDPSEECVLELPSENIRIPPTKTEKQSELVAGKITIFENKKNSNIYYKGYGGRIENEVFKTLKAREDWPRVVEINNIETNPNSGIKGEPHYSTILSWEPSNRKKSGTLDIQWCVFFPVGHQPPGCTRVEIPDIDLSITLNIHGFFFLDSDRMRIAGLEDSFEKNTGVCDEWNRELAFQGGLAYLIPAIEEFVKDQKLSFDQCYNLSNAIRQTGLWNSFKEAICSQRTWQPCWISGKSEWKSISSDLAVFLIPRISEPSKVLDCFPKLAFLSQRLNLVALDSKRELPGLHNDKLSDWNDELVLQLLEEVQLGTTGDDAAAEWLNAFLTDLQKDKLLTPNIYQRVSCLPLLPVRDARTEKNIRISVHEWRTAIDDGVLFCASKETNDWLGLLHPALPDWSCIIHENIPRWCTVQHAPSLNVNTAATIVVAQSRLGELTACTALVRHFLAQRVLPSSAICLAARYLMHAHAPQARDGDHFLFVPSSHADNLIWSRLIQQLFKHEGGENSWRLLDQWWASILSPQAQQYLRVSTIDEQGAWKELMAAQADFSTLEFPADEWTNEDVAKLLIGLFRAGQSNSDGTVSLLRKLRLHKLRGQSNERVSIAAADGRLDDLFVLHALNLEDRIPKELVPLWERFLSLTKVVERVTDELASPVQAKLFRSSTAEGEEYEATLNWNYVVRRSLAFPAPHEWAELIMKALSHGDHAARGLGPKLKQTKWLPLSACGSIAPDSIILIEGLEAELHELLDPAKDGRAGTRALPEFLVSQDGFATLKKYFPNLEQALVILGDYLRDKPHLHLGLVESSLPPEAEYFFPLIENISGLPGAALLSKLWRLPGQVANNSWHTLLRDNIWPAILRPFPYDKDGVTRLERVLVQLASTPSRLAFDAYLRQAVTDSVIELMLPRLSLVSQRGQWCSASLLIWPSANLDPSVQLCQEQDKILSIIRGAPIQPGAATSAEHGVQGHLISDNSLPSAPDFADQARIIENYLQPFRKGNVGDILPAALVAVLGSHPKMIKLLRELLQNGPTQDPDDFLLYLLGDQRSNIINENCSPRFFIEVVHGGSTQAQTITGDMVPVTLTADINTLIVGDPFELWRRCFYQHRPDTECHRLRLRAIERPDDLSDYVSIFASTIETILLKVHCNGVESECPANLKELLRDVADAGQADLKRSQFYLLDMAEARLNELAVRGFPAFEQVLRAFSEARQARVDADLLKTQSRKRSSEKSVKAEKLVTDAKRTLVSLLHSAEDDATRRTLVEAVRRKMTDFQYSLDSVALELFQNADDAVTEWDEMKRDLHPHERQFVVQLDTAQRRLELIHWGRPINRHAFPGFSQGLKRGYDQDLQKMLTLNFSDKGVGYENQPVMVTGRFGLGFKTVFFVADQPEVVSGRLAFEIRGGFYPVPLQLDRAKALREWAESLGVPGLVPTAIRLKWTESATPEKLAEAFQAFTQAAPLLIIFSRSIRTLTVKNGDTTATLTSHEDKKKLTSSGRFTHIQVGQQSYLCFRCSLRADARPASVLLPLDASGVSSLPDAMPRLWITTPTTEHSDLRWALNAPFKPDAGRQRLALNNPVNRQIAEEVAAAWLESLRELYDATQTRWDEFARQVGLHSSASFVTWWKQLWGEMSYAQPVTKWENLSHGGQVLGYVAWAESNGAMYRLIQQCPVIPTHLPGSYDRFVKSEDVRYSVTGMLADEKNGCFALIAAWPAVQKSYPPGKTVASRVVHFLRQVIPIQSLRGELNLSTALKEEIGNNQEVDPLKAERIGQLFLQSNALFQADSPYAQEVLRAVSSLAEVKMLASDGKYYSSAALVCPRSLTGLIDEDEAYRAKFAPPSAILCPEYTNTALHFFVKTRGQLATNAATLKSWVDRDKSDQLLPDIFQYLVNGELDQKLADQLGRDWFDLKRTTKTFLGLPGPDKNELERKFLKGQTCTQSHLIIPSLQDKPVNLVMDAKDAFRLVSNWWQEESETYIANYHNKTYPHQFPGNLPWPTEENWNLTGEPSSSGWLMLFIHAALVPLGFNKIGRDQSFTQFLVTNEWVDVFSRVSENPDALLEALDKYLKNSLQHTQFHFQMRQFIAFYAIAKNMESFLHSLNAAEKTEHPSSFNLVFSLNANPAFMGTGIIAPPLSGLLGIGTCQLLRELYRLGRLKNPHGYQFAFTPIRKVRRLCAQLFGTYEGYNGASSSQIIFEKLQRLSEGSQPALDPTFKHCFDLPFQYLAENKELRTRVLQEEFESDPEDNIELDAAPRDFSCPKL